MRVRDRLIRLAGALVLALPGALSAAAPSVLPAPVLAALERAGVPASAFAVIVQEAGSGAPWLAANERVAMNPASLAKLVTTYAALDVLGPAWTWTTPVWLRGRVADGVLEGDLVVRGSGDPTLVIERVWLLLRRVQQAGVREIRGDIVLDLSAFTPPNGSPGDFDGEPARPYNVQPDALMLNFKSVLHAIVPDPRTRRARIVATPPLAGAPAEQSVALTDGPCGDWRGALKLGFAEDGSARFGGQYPAACGERHWPVADAQPQTYNGRLLEGLWREMGGRLSGRAHAGAAPADVPPTFELSSPTLAEVVREINKFSNNTMAQQLFYTLAATAAPGLPASAQGARDRLQSWTLSRFGTPAELSLDNGSGLSRDTRISAELLARILQHAFASPVMPELIASLPVSGLDGTLRRSRVSAGRAHLKTGSLRDSAGVAGYVLTQGGRRLVVVALINHPNANAARPALEALVQWALDDGSAPNGPPK